MPLQFTTVSTKGQFVIPADIREALGITSGTRVAVVREGNRIILQPVNDQFLKETRGMTAGGPSLSDMLIGERRRDDQKHDDGM